MSLRNLITAIACALLTGCVGLPEKVSPVTDFELARYLGQWYEVARLDHSFERGLQNVTAHYSLREDGGVTVVNRGYSTEDGAWKEARGKAYFVREPDEGYLKVSFFGPFYGTYAIFGLDQDNYEYAFVCGPNLSYLWLLARNPAPSAETRAKFVTRAAELGFDTDQLLWISHENQPLP